MIKHAVVLACAGMPAFVAGAVPLDSDLPAYHRRARLTLRGERRLTTDAFNTAVAAGDVDLIRATREPLTPLVRAFLRFVLSRDGQQVLAEGPEKYLPLPADIARAQLAIAEGSR